MSKNKMTGKDTSRVQSKAVKSNVGKVPKNSVPVRTQRAAARRGK